MSGLIYYLPGPGAASRDVVVDWGLGYVLEGDEGVQHVGMSKGPDGGTGVAFAPKAGPGGRPAQLPHDAGRAEWQRMPGHPRGAWIGRVPGEIVRPQDVARGRQLGGHMTELADGQRWLVPVARMVNGATPLPTALRWDGSAWTQGEVLPRFRDLWAHGIRMWDLLIGIAREEGHALVFVDEAMTAVHALACNYRLGPAEVSMLGLLDTTSEVAVLKALVDWPSVEVLAAGKAEGAGP